MLSGEGRWGKFVRIAVCTHLHFKVRQASKYLEFSCLILAVLWNFGFRPTDPYNFPDTNLDQPSVVAHGQKLQKLGGGTSDHHGQSQQSASWLDWRWIEDTVPYGWCCSRHLGNCEIHEGWVAGNKQALGWPREYGFMHVLPALTTT